MRNVVLVGMPGCGKSTVGVLLAKTLMMDFVDTDLLLQRQSGKPLQQMVDELGTTGFSRAEEAFVKELRLAGTVIATGGSVALENEAMAALKQNGLVVFLRINYAETERRLQNIKTRGIAMEKGQTLKELYDLRQPAYLRRADAVVDADGLSIEETVEALAQIVRESEGTP